MARVFRALMTLSIALGVLAGGFFVGRSTELLSVGASGATGSPGRVTLDGQVTEETYAAAFESYLDCAADLGFALASDVTRDRFGKFGARLVATSDSGERLSGSLETCRQRELNDIEQAWVMAHPPTAAELKEARDLTAACLAHGEVAIHRQPTREELRDILVTAIRSSDRDHQAFVFGCFERTAEQLNWPGYGGG